MRTNNYIVKGFALFLLGVLILLNSSISYAIITEPNVINNEGILETKLEDTSDRTGVIIDNIIDGYINYTGSKGIAITDVDNNFGQWQYFDGVYWNNINDVDETKALLLPSNYKLIFVSDDDWFGEAIITIRGWNSNITEIGKKVDTTINGSGTNYSSGVVKLKTIVQPVNDPPVISDLDNGKLLYFNGEKAINGDGDHLSIEPVVLSDTFTIEMYSKWSALSNWSRLFDFGNGSPNQNIWAGMEGTTGRLIFEAYNRPDYSSKINVKSDIITTDRWIHTAFVYDGSNGFIYIDGELKGQGPLTIVTANRINNYFAKSNWDADDYYKGYLRDIRIWDKALSGEEIMNNKDKRLLGDEDNLVAYYSFDEGSGDILENKVSDSNYSNATIHGAKWVESTGINSTATTRKNKAVDFELKVKDIDTNTGSMVLTAISSDEDLISNTNINCNLTSEDGIITLNPNTDKIGSCNIIIKVTDGVDETIEYLRFNVKDIENTKPIAYGQSITLDKNTEYMGTVKGDDDDNDIITYRIMNQPSKGTVVITNADTGSYTYTPKSNYVGADSFTFVVNDGIEDSASALVSIIVNDIIQDDTSDEEDSEEDRLREYNESGIPISLKHLVIAKATDKDSNEDEVTKQLLRNKNVIYELISNETKVDNEKLYIGQSYICNVYYKLPEGQKIKIGSITLKVDEQAKVTKTDGDINPYNSITDIETGDTIDNVTVNLLYDDSDRNNNDSSKAGSLVKLPLIELFPQENKNPQCSNSDGQYAYAVYPYTDYYIIAKKSGYIPYISEQILVEDELIRMDFNMRKAYKGAYIEGYPDGTVKPDNHITRAEIAVLFSTLMDNQSESGSVRYTDIEPDSWYQKDVAIVSDSGLFDIYDGTELEPNNHVTIHQFAYIISRYMGISIKQLLRLDIIDEKYSDNIYSEVILTRADVVTMVNRMLNRNNTTYSTKKYKDIEVDHSAYKDIESASN